MSKKSLTFRLVVLFVAAGLLPAILVAVLTIRDKISSLTAAASAETQIIMESKGLELERMFDSLSKHIKSLSSNLFVVNSYRTFATGFESFAKETLQIYPVKEIYSGLNAFYKNEFSKKYSDQTKSSALGLDSLLGQLSPSGAALQYAYIAKNSKALGQKNELDSAGDSSLWSKAHKLYHPSFHQIVSNFSYYDIFLINLKGEIVYSYFKELDFATDLSKADAKANGLARVFNAAKSAKSQETFLSDLEPYFPSYEAPAMFIAAPITDGDTTIGVIAIQVPVDRIDQILTNGGKWKETGFGNTGETYVIGSDQIARSTQRQHVEDPKGYLAQASAIGLSREKAELIERQKSVATVLKVEHDAAVQAAAGKSAFLQYTDTLGIKSFATIRPLQIAGLKWSIISTISYSEAIHIDSAIVTLTLAGSIAGILIFIFAWTFSRQLSRKLGHIVETIKKTALAASENSDSLKRESQGVSAAAQEEAAAIQETVSTLNEITAMVNKSVDYAKRSAEKSQNSREVTDHGRAAVREMKDAMSEIDRSNASVMNAVIESNNKIEGLAKVISDIGDKTRVINDIVFQTKLLSFNASVEAARAGEHGKGFAVVAEEIGSLAQMSGDAAHKIEEMLTESREKVQGVVVETRSSVNRLIEQGKSKVESGVAIAARCDESLNLVFENVDQVAKMMEEIAAASREQSEGVSNITKAMNELDQATHSNARSATQTAQGAQNVSNLAAQLREAVKELEVQVYGDATARVPMTEAPRKLGVDQPSKSKSKIVPAPTKPIALRKSPPTTVSEQSNDMKIAVGSEVPAANDPRFEEL